MADKVYHDWYAWKAAMRRALKKAFPAPETPHPMFRRAWRRLCEDILVRGMPYAECRNWMDAFISDMVNHREDWDG